MSDFGAVFEFRVPGMGAERTVSMALGFINPIDENGDIHTGCQGSLVLIGIAPQKMGVTSTHIPEHPGAPVTPIADGWRQLL